MAASFGPADRHRSARRPRGDGAKMRRAPPRVKRRAAPTRNAGVAHLNRLAVPLPGNPYAESTSFPRVSSLRRRCGRDASHVVCWRHVDCPPRRLDRDRDRSRQRHRAGDRGGLCARGRARRLRRHPGGEGAGHRRRNSGGGRGGARDCGGRERADSGRGDAGAHPRPFRGRGHTSRGGGHISPLGAYDETSDSFAFTSVPRRPTTAPVSHPTTYLRASRKHSRARSAPGNRAFQPIREG